MTVKSLEVLAGIFKGNPSRFTAGEISEKAKISLQATHKLLLLHYRRPDLLKEVLADRLPVYKAIARMRTEPDKWVNTPRTRL